jgi:L-threonylcarbamoyladenylate synthase
VNLTTLIRAAAILRSGGLVAFPTETVYGLGADATDAAAVQKIFAAKGRPSTNPLICHVPDATVARRYVTSWPDEAEKLADRFWPGPLSLVLPKGDAIPHEVTAGRGTVALRAPKHPLTLSLLRIFDRPLAGPSANKSTHVSPTTAQHVREEFPAGEVDMILDGGPCDVGIESTVLDLSAGRPTILRPGGVSREQIEQVIGPVDLFTGAADPSVAAASPGQHEKHYAPRTPAYRFDASQRASIRPAVRRSTSQPIRSPTPATSTPAARRGRFWLVRHLRRAAARPARVDRRPRPASSARHSPSRSGYRTTSQSDLLRRPAYWKSLHARHAGGARERDVQMGRFQSLDWGSTLLQRRLDREGAVATMATMEVVTGDTGEATADEPGDDHVDLNLGPYTVSPLRGLHFSTADDTAAS